MKKGGKLGVMLIGLTLVIALVLAWWLYPMGAASKERAQTLALALAPAGPASGPTTSAGSAAETYRKAVELIERLRADPAEENRLDRYDQGNFDPEAGEFFVRHGEILRLVHGGAGIAACDWGEASMETRMATLNGLRGLANFTLAHARFAGSKNEPGVMLEDVLATMALGRHVGAGGILVQKQSEMGIEIKAIQRLAAGFGRLNREQLEALPARLSALPPSATGKQMLEAELAFAKKAGRQQGVIVTAMADGLEKLYRELGAVIDQQSPEEFAKTANAAVANMKVNAFAPITAPSIISAREAMAVVQAKRAMLRAAIDIQLNGEAALSNSKDPFGEGPFVLTKSGTGYELGSKRTHRGSAVTLTVGGE